MAVAQNKKLYTPKEYLEIERKAIAKNEFYKGEIFAMSGASRNHVVITTNLLVLLATQLKGTPCRPLSSDMRIHIPANGLYTYPDVSVVCGQENFLDDEFDTLINPTLIVEVLSPSTADYDAGRKFTFYRSIPSLKEYVLVSSTEYRVQLFTRTNERAWLMTESTGNVGLMNLSSINASLQISEVFEGIAYK
jgi:Uma2 family endonuclease